MIYAVTKKTYWHIPDTHYSNSCVMQIVVYILSYSNILTATNCERSKTMQDEVKYLSSRLPRCEKKMQNFIHYTNMYHLAHPQYTSLQLAQSTIPDLCNIILHPLTGCNTFLQSQNTIHTSAYTSKSSTTVECRHNLQLVRTPKTNPTQIMITYSCNYHSPPLIMATMSNSTAPVLSFSVFSLNIMTQIVVVRTPKNEDWYQ